MRTLKVTRKTDRGELEEFFKGETDYRVRERLLMIIHVLDGKRINEVAKILLCSERTVSKWVKRYNEMGLNGLKDQDRKGAPRKIDYENLKQALDKKPEEFGYEASVWYPTLVYNYIRDFQGITIAFDYTYVLIRNLGYSLVVPRTKSYKSNPDKVILFKKKVKKL